eukprot:7542916-Pyramimonas_sp.AAC.2
MLQGEDDGSTVVSMGAYVEARDAEKPLGVYAVYDAEKKVQYVGYSRNVVVALKTHSKRLGAEKCAYTRVMVFANKVSTSSRSLSLQGSLHGKRGVNQFECGLREPGEPPPAIFAMATRANMETEVQHWLRELGETPPGNGPSERDLWDEFSSSMSTDAMSPAELAEYEEKKLKMRKAMGENLFDDVDGETVDSKQRRLNFLQ